MELTLQVQSHEGTLRLSCHGNAICGEESEALQAALVHLLAAEGRDRLVVDLQHLRKLDCAALGVLADAALRARQIGKSLELANVPAAVQALLRTTRLESVFFGSAAAQAAGSDRFSAA